MNIAAHELRTPIQPILGLADILRSKETEGGERAEYLDVIIRNVKRYASYILRQSLQRGSLHLFDTIVPDPILLD